MTRHQHRLQRGMSLIEVMIALTLSLFLLAGLVELAVTNKSTYGFQQGQSTTNENGRFAMSLLDKYVGLAGFRNESRTDLVPSFPAIAAANNCPAFADGQVVAQNKTSTGLCIRNEPPRDPADSTKYLADCSGNVPTTSAVIVSELYYDATTRMLACRVATRQADLIDNIANFRITYGIDTRTTIPASGPNMMLTAYTLSPADWTKIVTLRFALLTTSEGQEAIGSQSYPFPLTSSTMTAAAAGDKRLYKSYEQTVPLRNILP